MSFSRVSMTVFRVSGSSPSRGFSTAATQQVAKIPKVARVPKILPAPKPIVPVKIVRSALYKAQESGIVRETALAEYLSKTTKLSRTDVLKVLVALPEAITELVRDNDLMVRIKGFGSFKPRTRAARIGRNPATGAPINILASKSVFFSVHKNIALKDDENVEENSK